MVLNLLDKIHFITIINKKLDYGKSQQFYFTLKMALSNSLIVRTDLHFLLQNKQLVLSLSFHYKYHYHLADDQQLLFPIFQILFPLDNFQIHHFLCIL